MDYFLISAEEFRQRRTKSQNYVYPKFDCLIRSIWNSLIHQDQPSCKLCQLCCFWVIWVESVIQLECSSLSLLSKTKVQYIDTTHKKCKIWSVSDINCFLFCHYPQQPKIIKFLFKMSTWQCYTRNFNALSQVVLDRKIFKFFVLFK